MFGRLKKFLFGKKKSTHDFRKRQPERSWDETNTSLEEPVEFYNEANGLCDQGRFADAIALYTRALECDPLADQDYEKQLSAEGSQWIPFDPADQVYTSVKTYLNRASVYMDLDRYAEAIDDYAQAIRICPECDYAFQARANSYQSFGFHMESQGDTTAALEAFSQSKRDLEAIGDRHGVDLILGRAILDVLVHLVRVLVRLERWEDATATTAATVRLMSQIVEIERDSENGDWGSAPIGMRNHARSLRDGIACILFEDDLPLAQAAAAAECCLNLGHICHTSLEQFDLAEELLCRGEPAIQKLAQMQQVGSDDDHHDVSRLLPQLHNYRGLLFMDSGRCTEAAAEFQAAIEYRTEQMNQGHSDRENVVYLGGAYCNQGFNCIDEWQLAAARTNFQRAIDLLEKCLGDNGDNSPQVTAEQFLANAREGLAEADRWEGTPTQTYELEENRCFETVQSQIMAALPNPFDVEFPPPGDAESKLKDGPPPDAVAQLNEWLESHNDHAEAWYWKGKLQSESGALNDAITSVEKALQYQPQFEAALFELADLQRRCGLFAAATATWKRLEEQALEESDVWYLRGVIASERSSHPVENHDGLFELDLEMAHEAVGYFNQALLAEFLDDHPRMAKASVLARLARATEASLGSAYEVYTQVHDQEDVADRRLEAARRRFTTLLKRADELYEECAINDPDDDDASSAWTALREEYPLLNLVTKTQDPATQDLSAQ